MTKRKLTQFGESAPVFDAEETVQLLNSFGFDYDNPSEWGDQANQPLPVPVGREYDERQMPIDWDYKTAVTGPNGEPLPSKAQGWNFHGKPDFGTGISGWWDYISWKFTNNNQAILDNSPTLKELGGGIEQTWNFWEAERQAGNTDRWKRDGQTILALVGGIASAIGGAWRHAEQIGPDEPGVTVWNAIPRVVGAAFDTLGYGFEALDRAVKEHITIPTALNSIAGLRANQLVSDEQIDKWRDWIGPLGLFPLWANSAFYSLTGQMNMDDVDEDRNLLAARLGYTAWKEAATKEEFLRRVASGEDPRLLAMELQDPVHELGGEFLFDPLNYLGLFSRQILLRGKDMGELNAIRKVGNAARKLFGAIDDAPDEVRHLKQAELFKWIDEGIATAKVEMAGEVAQAGQWRRLKGFFALNAESRRSMLTGNLTDAVHELFALTKNPDDTVRLVRYMADLMDDAALTADRLKALEHIQFAVDGNSIPLGTLFSNRMRRTALVWQRLGSESGIKRLHEVMVEAGNDIVKMNELLAGELGKVVDDIFPTIRDRVVQNKKYRQLVDANETQKVENLLKKRPWAAEAPDALHATLLKAYEPLRKLYKPMGQAQGVIFMGLNPAYRMRNRMGNFAVLFVDKGPWAAAQSITDARFLPWGKRAAIDGLNDWMGGAGLRSEFEGIGKRAGSAASFDDASWMEGKFSYFAKGASEDEAVAGVHIMSRSVQRVMRRVLNQKQALKGLDDAVHSADDAKAIERLIHNKRGNAVEAIRDFAGDVGIDETSNLLFLENREIAKLRRLEIEDMVRVALDPSLPLDEQIAKLDEIIENHRSLGNRTAGESVAREGSEFASELTEGAKDIGGERGVRLGDAMERKLYADEMAVNTAQKAFRSGLAMLREMVARQFSGEAATAGLKLDKGLTAAINVIGEFDTKADDVADLLMSDMRQLHVGLREEVLQFVRKDANSLTKDDLLGIWQSRAWMGEAPNHVDDFDIPMFKAAVWEGYFRRIPRSYHKTFMAQSDIYLDMLKQTIAALDPDGTAKLAEKFEPMFASIRRQQGRAEAMARAVVDDDGFMVARYGPAELEDLVIEEMARLEGIGTKVEDIEKLREVARNARRHINDLRKEFKAGTLDIEDLPMTDDLIRKSFENVADSRANRTNMLEVLLAKEPDDLLTIKHLEEFRDDFIAASRTKDTLRDELSNLQEVMNDLGNPARNAGEVDIGSKILVPGPDGKLIEVQVAGRYKTPKTKQTGFEYVTASGKKRILANKITILESEANKAKELDKLQIKKNALAEELKTAAEELDDAVQRRVDNINQQIDDVKGTLDPTHARVQEIVNTRFEKVEGEDLPQAYLAVRPTTDTTYKISIGEEGRFALIQPIFGADQGRMWRPGFIWAPEDVRGNVTELVFPEFKKITDETGVPFGVTTTTKKLEDKYRQVADMTEEILEGDVRRFIYDPKRTPDERFAVNVVAPMDDVTPTPARMEHIKFPFIKKAVDDIKEHVQSNQGSAPMARATNYSADDTKNLVKWGEEAQTRINEARHVAGQIASAERDFGLHNYGKRYGFDLVAGLIFPYQFWYSRSYVKWMKRMVQNPSILSAYLRYRRTLEKMHAGMPDWWKFQLSTNEVLGMNSENPLFFNLEAMVNPLNGLTNVDFTDPERRKDNWGAAMEDIQKMGPSVWTPFVLALASFYSFKGEKEAAARWAGRLLPQSKAFRDATALIDPKGLGVELDPSVHIFSGGTEAYERGRVGRQLGMMLNEGKYSPEDIIDAGYRQTGPIWDVARARAIHDRAGNMALISGQFLFGVGLKPRPQNDIQIDNMYREMYNLIGSRPNMPIEKYTEAWNVLREAYPFMDTVLLSKKHGQARDEALAWNVLNRIPPGKSFELAEQVSLDFDVLSKFRENKGDLSMLNEAERLEFMAGVMQLSALLAIPDQMTRRDWTQAKNSYSEMLIQGEAIFGEDIWQKVDLYYAAFDENNQDAMRNFLRANPIVQEALDFKQMVVNGNPMLSSYYSSAEKLEKFYKGQFYQTVEQVFGEDIWDKWSVYHELREMDENNAANRYYDEHPELKGYQELRDEVLPLIDTKIIELAGLIDKPKGPFYRDENTMPDPAVGVQSFNVDAQQRWIEEQVMAYAQGEESGRFKDHTDAMDVIRSQADARWPNTRTPANTYYKKVDGDPSGAAGMLQENPELEARVKWEFERILRIALSREDELEASAARFDEELQSIGAAPDAPTSFENLASGPLQRLLNDPDGLPPHLMELLQGQ